MYSIKHLFHIDSPRAQIFEAIDTIKGLSEWWTNQTSGETTVGGEIIFRFGEHTGFKMRVTQKTQNESIAWECVGGPPDWVGTKLSFQLDENEGKTRIRFAHDGWQKQDDFYGACSFSWGNYMSSLRKLCQDGKGEPFGSRA